MKNKKGFTLIELLAVIVVLAIIIIIATINVNKQINKTRKRANDINKKMIIKAYKLCSAQELDLSKCDSIPKLIANGYLDEFNDPYNSKENEINNAYTLIVNDDIAKVIYNGDGVQQVYEIPPTQYFSWCNEDNGKHSCTDGLSNEGKSWLQKHDDILTFPDTIKTIKNCESSEKNCSNFSDVQIDALIVTSNVSINATFKNAKIGVIKVDGCNLGSSIFQNTTINNLIVGNTGNMNIGQSTFSGSKIQNFKIENGTFNWYSFTGSIIDTLTIGKGVTSLGNDTFEGAKINKLIIKANNLNGNSEQPFRNSNTPINIIIDKDVTKLGKNVIANNTTSYCNYVRMIPIKSILINGDKKRFSKRDLYNFGLRWDQIPSDIGNPMDDSYRLKLSKSSDFESLNCYNSSSKKYPFPSWVDIID